MLFLGVESIYYVFLRRFAFLDRESFRMIILSVDYY